MTDDARERVTLTSELNRAIERDELRLHYQPLVDTESFRVNGLDVLVRWQHRERGMVRPDSFIRLAEETGLIIPLSAWVMRRACLQAREWEAAGIPFGRIALTSLALRSSAAISHGRSNPSCTKPDWAPSVWSSS